MTGCAPRGYVPDPLTSCSLLRSAKNTIRGMGVHELADYAWATPVENDVRQARARVVTAQVMGGVAGGAAVVGLVLGFSTDAATQPDARNAAYAIGGVAIGAVLVASITAWAGARSTEKAKERLIWWADRCNAP